MSDYERLSLGLYGAQSVILVAVLIVYARQLATMREQMAAARHSATGQNLLALANFLQAEDVREARRVVIQALKGRGFIEWTLEEKQAAAKVCSSYGTAGVVIETGLVPAEPIIENWGPSIRNCYEVLQEFIRDMQRRDKNGPAYWAVFDRLYARAVAGPKEIV